MANNLNSFGEAYKYKSKSYSKLYASQDSPILARKTSTVSSITNQQEMQQLQLHSTFTTVSIRALTTKALSPLQRSCFHKLRIWTIGMFIIHPSVGPVVISPLEP
jgi:hypothetical protein